MGPFLLLPWPLWLSPRLRPIPMFTADLVDTTVAISDTLDSDTLDTDTDSDTAMDQCTARGLLMLSLRPRPRLILTTDTDTVLDTLDTILDTLDTVDSDTVDSLDTMDSDTMVVSDTTARGLLMLSLRPRPMLIPT